MKNKYEAVAYHAMQYAPALCIWQSVGDNDCIKWEADGEFIRAGFMDDTAQPTIHPRWYKIHYTFKGGYIRVHDRRYYLSDFIKIL